MNNCILNKLSAAQFAVTELVLYLDTHPNDEEMKSLWAQYTEKVKELTAQYEEKYGPLTTQSGAGCEWVKGPWPWQCQGGNV